MAEPNTREDFGSYCLRQLGDPVIHIEITPEQVDDRIDDALTMWREYHFDAVSRTYLKHQVTSTDLVNHWIPCSDDIQSVVRVLQCDEGNLNIFDIRGTTAAPVSNHWMNNSVNCWNPSQRKSAAKLSYKTRKVQRLWREPVGS